MPVILPTEAEEQWIKGDLSPLEITQILKPFPEDQMLVYPVSEKVNSPKNDCPEIVDPFDIPQ
jgi:putative SOS response-associated peptidase YedK